MKRELMITDGWGDVLTRYDVTGQPEHKVDYLRAEMKRGLNGDFVVVDTKDVDKDETK